MIVFHAVLLIATVGLAVPASVFFLQCLLAQLGAAKTKIGSTQRPRIAVLVPAHNESASIAGTVALLLRELAPTDRLVVVADNCSDDTQLQAAGAGAEVIARQDSTRRGKGFALAFGMEHLNRTGAPDVLVIFDADCSISSGGIEYLARVAVSLNRPIQADYLLRAPATATPRTTISALAFLVRNRVRPLGLKRIGVPCHLMGSGMAFPWHVIRKAPPYGDNLVEDLAMGLDLSLLGHPPYFCPEVQVESELPNAAQAAIGQRKRWEHGMLATLIQFGPRLARAGLQQGPARLVQALDLAVPPLAMLVAILLFTVCGGSILWGLGLSPLAPVAIAMTSLCAVAVAVGISWARFARDTVPFRILASIPLYFLWKLPLYLSFIRGKRQKGWVRTDREYKEPPSA
jgi:cellulose synthase/poly-beta-1,6-N-acetylglucosamine synthase-like glycosyltransferase